MDEWIGPLSIAVVSPFDKITAVLFGCRWPLGRENNVGELCRQAPTSEGSPDFFLDIELKFAL